MGPVIRIKREIASLATLSVALYRELAMSAAELLPRRS